MFVSASIREQFPEAWIRSGHPLDAAISLGFKSAEAWELSQSLIRDPEIIAKRDELLAKFGLEFFLPNQIEIAQEVLTQARREQDGGAKVKMYALYCGLRGFSTEKIEDNGRREVKVLVRSTVNRPELIDIKAG